MRARLPAAFVLMSGAVALFAQEAAEGGGHAEGWTAPIWGVPMIAWQVANLLLVIALFIYLLRKPAPKFFGDRSKDIQTQLDQANRDKEEALARLKEVEQRMASLQSEVASIEEASLKAAEADKLQVQAEAEAMRERIRKETTEEIERRMVEARRELRRFAADAAVALAREALERDVVDADEERLRQEFLSRLEEVAHGRRG